MLLGQVSYFLVYGGNWANVKLPKLLFLVLIPYLPVHHYACKCSSPSSLQQLRKSKDTCTGTHVIHITPSTNQHISFCVCWQSELWFFLMRFPHTRTRNYASHRANCNPSYWYKSGADLRLIILLCIYASMTAEFGLRLNRNVLILCLLTHLDSKIYKSEWL